MNKDNMFLKEALQLGVEACERSAVFFEEQEKTLREGYDGETARKYRNASVFLGVLLQKEKDITL